MKYLMKRTEALHIDIMGNVKYKKINREKIRQIDDEIKMKYSGDKYREIIQLIEKYEDAVVKDGTICEKNLCINMVYSTE